MFNNVGTTVGGACYTVLNVLFTLMNDRITLVKVLINMFVFVLFTTVIKLMVQDLV